VLLFVEVNLFAVDFKVEVAVADGDINVAEIVPLVAAVEVSSR